MCSQIVISMLDLTHYELMVAAQAGRAQTDVEPFWFAHASHRIVKLTPVFFTWDIIAHNIIS